MNSWGVLLKRLVAAILFTVALANCQTKEQWKEYSFPKDGFAISAPSAPVVHPDPQNSEVRVYSFQFDPNTRLAIRVADWKIDCDAKLKQLKENAPPTSQLRELSLGKHIGIESIEPSSTRPGTTVTERLFCLEDKVIMLSIGYPAKSTSQAVKRTLDSFRLTEN
jgi:hypothetical protein